mmetsp:Transcript_19625/g.28225  ORF Transcript_19625/g.28225 Transcript_19625/m.28225 type:complete len:121 (+) Transcript_19625:313-675(+)|eukprot:CAMPEP_0185044256 /NCGR_PEP_ID=MMETSP1103-20130426/43345_1 /TAXON_ID=36769 /ORGANISM="Paraphysomonas bandaiensis, Strain Caron Lab Isolate" /LENGTH=120 /DNA_ID=CAMNT_0027584499 /DNA_START=920 /DNA_END=1282 /DNA_ORIENTATION=-
MTKFLNDSWMVVVDEGSYTEVHMGGWWASRRGSELKLNSPITVSPDTSCKDVIALLQSRAFDMMPVQSPEDCTVMGVVTEGNLTTMITQNRIYPHDPCKKAVYKVQNETVLSELAAVFDR